MLYDSSTNKELHAWLVKTLEPICDAEPEALATYIVALLKNDVSEHDLRTEAVKQLDEFFENGASDFVDTLFAALRSKSYIPYTSTSTTYTPVKPKPQDAGIPIPLDALLSPTVSTSPEGSRKRSHEDDDRDVRGPPKGPRLGTDAYFARHSQPNGHGHGQADNWHRGPMDGPQPEYGMNVGMNGHMGNGQRTYQPLNGRPMLPRGVCRDYHLKGFCSRGAMCKYSHDDAAIAPQIPFGAPPMGAPQMPFLPMYGALPFGMGTGQSPTYDPNDAHMDMLPHGPHNRVPSMPRGQNGDNEAMQMYGAHGEQPVVQDLTPPVARENAAPIDMAPLQPLTGSSSGAVNDVHMQSPPSHLAPAEPHATPQAGRPPRGGNAAFRGRGRGERGTFSGDHQNFPGSESGRDTKTIVVEKIPEDKLSLEAVNSWFKRFGTVTNVAVDAKGGKALVSFSAHDEAYAAWKAEEAVFNNRFVKIFWHRPMEGQGGAGARALQASAPLVANMAAREAAAPEVRETAKPMHSSASISNSKSKPINPSLAALQAKQELLQKQITEQKELMAKLSTATAPEKKEIMARLRKLDSEMKVPSVSSSTTTKPTPQRASSVPKEDDKERRKKELLDMELEMHAKTVEDVSPAEETTESLQEKLARLQEEAKALGISDTAQPYVPPYRGFRGRGRGRAGYRGAMRGGPPRASMKLDNRPKALVIKDIPSHDPEAVEAVRSWFENSGLKPSLDILDDSSIVVSFQTRATAEQALAKGVNIPSVGTVKLSWHADAIGPKAQPAPTAKPAGLGDDRPPSPRPEDLPEESGWGNEEDGMGMF